MPTLVMVLLMAAELLTFDAAQAWLKSRVNVPTSLSSAQLALRPDFPASVRAHAFFSARVTSANVLGALRQEIESFTAGATDIASARARLKTFLAGQGVAADDVGAAGTPPAGMDEDTWKARRRISNLASTRRLDLILRQNAGMAHALGQRQVSEQPEVRARWPYYRYIAVGDGRTRPAHKALDNLVLPKDDPFWATHTPPWEFGCRCQLEDADADDAKQYGLGKAVTKELPDGSQTATVVTGGGQTVNILPPTSGFTFRADAAFREPDWTLIQDGELRQIVKAEFDKLRPPPVPKIAEIAPDISGADAFGARLKLTSESPGGSTGAVMADDDEGTRYVFKDYGGNELQVKNEWLANRFYVQMGVPVAEARLARVNGRLGIASRRLDQVRPMGSQHVAWAADTAAAQRGFVTDAWLANWDVAGTGGDNILLQPGKKSRVYRVDQGGSLLYRAQGAPKGAAFGKEVKELQTLRDSTVNPHAAQLFAKVTDADVAGQIVTFVNRVKAADIVRLVNAAALPPAQAKELTATLTARRSNLMKWRRDYLARTGGAAPAVPKQQAVSRRPAVAATPRELVEATKRHAQELTAAERAAVDRFTGSGYGTMNRAALAGRSTPALDSALEKLPGYTGYSVRKIANVPGVADWFGKWKSGEWAHVEWKAYSSSSIKPGGVFSDSGGVAFIVRNRGLQGGYVAPISSVRSEAELLYGRNARFVVRGWAESKAGQRRAVLLEETDGTVPDRQPAPPRFEYDQLMAEWKQQVSGNETYYSALNAEFVAVFGGEST